MKTDNRGFSLVELIVVIAIMAVLVGILAPQFIKYVDKSRMSIDIQNVQNLCRVVETYAADAGEHGEDIPDTASFTLSCDSDISTSDDYITHAFADQELDSVRLKSHSWFASSNTSKTVTITVSDLGAGMPKFEEGTGELDGSLSIVKGITNPDAE